MTQPNPFGTNPFAQTRTESPAATGPRYTDPAQASVAHLAPLTSPAPAAAPTYGDDPFGAPAPRADRPRIMDLEERLLLITPKRLEENVPNNLDPKNPQDRMTADVIVLDGGPVAFGGRPEEGVPHSKQAAVPMSIEGMWISNKGLVSQLREALRARLSGAGKGMVLGRLHKGPKGKYPKPPWLLTTTPTEEDKQLARAYLAATPQDPFGGATSAS